MFTLPYKIDAYNLLSCIDSDGWRTIYEAEQISTDRKLLVEVADKTQVSEQAWNEYINNIRIKAQVDLTIFGDIYEAGIETHNFFCYELLPGTCLKKQQPGTLAPPVILHIVHALADMAKELKTKGIRSEKLLPRHVYYVDDHSPVRTNNIAIAGEYTDEDEQQLMTSVAELMLPLIQEGSPGATRLKTLFTWMIEGVDQMRLSWDQVDELIIACKTQLGLIHEEQTPNEHASPILTIEKEMVKKVAKRAGTYIYWIIIGGILVTLGGLIFFNKKKQHETAIPKRALAESNVLLGDGTTVLQIDKHEVTIGEYKEFLDHLTSLPKDKQTQYNHKDQPTELTTQTPYDWKNILQAIEKKQPYHGMSITWDHPVFNVTWWNANAYANWKHRELPSRLNWHYLLLKFNPAGGDTNFCSVDHYKLDVDIPTGVSGITSGLAEWTSTIEIDKKKPGSKPVPVIVGGYYNKPNKRHATFPLSADHFDQYTGFRTIKTNQPNKKPSS